MTITGPPDDYTDKLKAAMVGVFGRSSIPDWLRGLTHRDWLLDGGRCTAEQWAQLDWSTAFMDYGPSPAGNAGPYWHVMDRDGDCQHRLYPKLLQTKWAFVFRQAIEEAKARP